MNTFLNVFSKHCVQLLAYLVKERLHGQGSAPSFRSVHLSVLRSWFVAGWYVPSLKDFVEERNFTHDKAEFLNQNKRIFS